MTEKADSNAETIGAKGPFSLRVGDMQDELSFNIIGHTTLSDGQIADLCKELDKDWVYDMFSNSCHHFVYVVACGLVKLDDRSLIWDLIYVPPEFRPVLDEVRETHRLPLTNTLISNALDTGVTATGTKFLPNAIPAAYQAHGEHGGHTGQAGSHAGHHLMHHDMHHTMHRTMHHIMHHTMHHTMHHARYHTEHHAGHHTGFAGSAGGGF